MSNRSVTDRSNSTLQAAQPAIALDDVWLKFHLRYHRKRVTLRGAAITGLSSLLTRRGRARANQDFWALRGISLTVPHGAVLGVVGFNGSGKSTLLRVIAGIYAPDRGRVETTGGIATLLSFGAGFDGRRSGRENIYNNGVLLGLRVKQIDERVDDIIELSELGDFIDAPVATYSSGMRARLGFAVATKVNPDIMLIDEVIGAGDKRFRTRVGNIFDQFSRGSRTVVFVTHDMALLSEYCTCAVWLNEGKIHLEGSPAEVAEAYLASSGKPSGDASSKGKS